MLMTGSFGDSLSILSALKSIGHGIYERRASRLILIFPSHYDISEITHHWVRIYLRSVATVHVLYIFCRLCFISSLIGVLWMGTGDPVATGFVSL